MTVLEGRARVSAALRQQRQLLEDVHQRGTHDRHSRASCKLNVQS